MKRTAISRAPSNKQRNFQKALALVSPQILARGCEFGRYAGNSGPQPPMFWSCSGPDVVHHAKGRIVRDANEPENLRCLCDKHHKFAHAHSEWARDVSLMLSRL